MLDFCGGVFSLLQLVIEAVGNNRPIIGDGAFNAIKFVLSILSIGYNIIFFIQHYIIYPPKKHIANGKSEINPTSKTGSVLEKDSLLEPK